MVIKNSILAPEWDSTLQRSGNDFTLTFHFKIFLHAIQSKEKFDDGNVFTNGKGVLIWDQAGHYKLNDWADGEWATYRRRFVEILTSSWSGRFTLVPNKPWLKLESGEMIAAKIFCKLSIELVVNKSEKHHQKYRIVHTQNQDAGFRSYADHYTRSAVLSQTDITTEWMFTGPKAHLYPTIVETNVNGKIKKEKHNVEFAFNRLVHEFGHTLGLNHVNGIGNESYNYGITLKQRMSIMGYGSHFYPEHGIPWVKRLGKHLIAQNHQEHTLKFTSHLTDSLQLITYWDNGELKK